MKIVVLLQNAWSPVYAEHGHWPREYWLRALFRCTTGRRIQRCFLDMFPEHTFYIDNATLSVGNRPESVCPPDPHHIMRVIKREKPDILVCCGRVVNNAISKMSLPDVVVVSVAHPSARGYIDEEYTHSLRKAIACLTK